MKNTHTLSCIQWQERSVNSLFLMYVVLLTPPALSTQICNPQKQVSLPERPHTRCLYLFRKQFKNRSSDQCLVRKNTVKGQSFIKSCIDFTVILHVSHYSPPINTNTTPAETARAFRFQISVFLLSVARLFTSFVQRAFLAAVAIERSVDDWRRVVQMRNLLSTHLSNLEDIRETHTHTLAI